MQYVVIAAAIALAACAQRQTYSYTPPPQPTAPKFEAYEPTQLSKKQMEAVRAGVRDKLRDPDSARFGGMVAGKDAKGFITVCGWVNAKNAYGGYTGDQPYMGLLATGPKGTIFAPIGVGGDDIEQQSTMMVCQGHGLSLP
jgi:hypothetical protein